MEHVRYEPELVLTPLLRRVPRPQPYRKAAPHQSLRLAVKLRKERQRRLDGDLALAQRFARQRCISSIAFVQLPKRLKKVTSPGSSAA